jgi:hypothetical protein
VLIKAVSVNIDIEYRDICCQNIEYRIEIEKAYRPITKLKATQKTFRRMTPQLPARRRKGIDQSHYIKCRMTQHAAASMSVRHRVTPKGGTTILAVRGTKFVHDRAKRAKIFFGVVPPLLPLWGVHKIVKPLVLPQNDNELISH